ncbi:MAG: nucleotidyl transferase AbiEii/AbiGii toxin family protein [Nanoarchaeota archaeon]
MDKIKRLTNDEFTHISSQYTFNRNMLAKDYYITIILYLLKDVKGIYFKGGTALQKLFLNYSRLSEDIDYTITRNIDELKKEITKILINSNFFKHVREDKNVEGFIRLIFHYTNFDDKQDTIFIDLNKRSKLLEKPKIHNISHFYNKFIPNFYVNTLSKKEMFAEKLAATIGRNKPRDHFDIYMIIKSNQKLDLKLAKEKCKLSGYDFDIIKMFNKAKKLHKRWQEDMLPLLSNEIEYKEVIKTLARHFNLKSFKEELKK